MGLGIHVFLLDKLILVEIYYFMLHSFKYSLFALVFAVINSCTTDNTDLSVDSNENPIQASVIIDTIPPPLDTLMFNKLALDCFYNLGASTGGEFYFKTGAESVHSTIIDVLNDHGENGSDIIFLIDKTGSMSNDIDSVRINLNLIIDQIEKLSSVRLGIATYGDKNVDGGDWWNNTEISEDFNISRRFINGLQVSDGGDTPESVYDGIANVINETDWRENSKKMILVIGDAPSLEDSLSDYSRKDILKLCAKNGIKANLFPILVTPFTPESFVDYSDPLNPIIVKIYPNPASDKINIDFAEENTYTITVLDLDGKVVISKKFTGDRIEIPIPIDVPNGTYILRAMEDNYNMSAERIIIKH
ncbi:MAG: hypothetical protein ACJASQ_000166 [Crocinitomicaceae bacterium]|jgi:hypothetical protein